MLIRSQQDVYALVAFAGLGGNGGEDAPDARVVILEGLGGDLGGDGGDELAGALGGLWRCGGPSDIGFDWSGFGGDLAFAYGRH